MAHIETQKYLALQTDFVGERYFKDITNWVAFPAHSQMVNLRNLSVFTINLRLDDVSQPFFIYTLPYWDRYVNLNYYPVEYNLIQSSKPDIPQKASVVQKLRSYIFPEQQNYLADLLKQPADFEHDILDEVEFTGPTFLPFLQLQLSRSVRPGVEQIVIDSYLRGEDVFIFRQLFGQGFDFTRQIDNQWYKAMMQNSLQELCLFATRLKINLLLYLENQWFQKQLIDEKNIFKPVHAVSADIEEILSLESSRQQVFLIHNFQDKNDPKINSEI